MHLTKGEHWVTGMEATYSAEYVMFIKVSLTLFVSVKRDTCTIRDYEVIYSGRNTSASIQNPSAIVALEYLIKFKILKAGLQ
jgi:hypothetical protein